MAVGQGYTSAGSGRGPMRAADTDRDRAVGFITAAFAEGRLTKDEYDERLERALSARTYADLDMLVADLPGARVVAAPAPRVARTNPLAAASLACALGQFALGPIPTIPAIVLGHMARHQIRRTGEQGAGLALAGLLIGWAAVVLMVIAVAGAVAIVSHTAVVHHAVPGPPPP